MHIGMPGQMGADQEAAGKAAGGAEEMTHVYQCVVDSASAVLHFRKCAGWNDMEMAWRDG